MIFFSKILLMTVLFILVGGLIFFWSWDSIMKHKDKKAGEKYCKQNGFKFIKAKSYELHTRIYFEKDGFKGWTNYKTDKHYNIIWEDKNPLEKYRERNSIQ